MCRLPNESVGQRMFFHVTLEESNQLREQDDLPALIEEDFE